MPKEDLIKTVVDPQILLSGSGLEKQLKHISISDMDKLARLNAGKINPNKELDEIKENYQKHLKEDQCKECEDYYKGLVKVYQ